MSNRDILKNGLENLGITVDDKMLDDFIAISTINDFVFCP